MAFKKGDHVHFSFMIEPVVQGRKHERRTGTGVIASDEINYSCWPPGRTVEVVTSPDYKSGTMIAVTTTNLRKLGESTPASDRGEQSAVVSTNKDRRRVIVNASNVASAIRALSAGGFNIVRSDRVIEIRPDDEGLTRCASLVSRQLEALGWRVSGSVQG